jgi:hypothetical protein
VVLNTVLNAVPNAASRKKNPLNAKRLPYPKVSARVAPLRAQRHVPDSIKTLRLALIADLARRLGSGAGVARRTCKKGVLSLPPALIQTRIANAFREEDANAIVNGLRIESELMTQ